MRKPNQLTYSQNEPRHLLASIVLNGSELILGGDVDDNVAEVSVSGNNLIASISGAESATFDVADIDSILFVGLGGDDRFTNNTSISSSAFGQAGNDTLIGGSGNDRLIGGSGDDVLTGNAGDDEIRGGSSGDKTIDGGDGDDRLFGGNDTNNISGGAGNDLIFGGETIDIVFGDDGDDQIFPGNGNNTVDAGDGDDEVVSGRDADEVIGGAGDDLIFTGSGNDTIDGGDGDDWIGAGDGNDTLNGDAGADRLRGGAGDDVIRGGTGVSAGKFELQTLGGGEGDDEIFGGDQVDFVRGDDGNDEISLGAGDDIAFGGAGDDEIDLGADNDFAQGGDGDDTILGGTGDDVLFGNGGDDRLVGGSGRDAAEYFFGESRYRIAGSDLLVRDLVGDDGQDDVDQIERLRFASPSGIGSIAAESQIEEFVTVQPIIAANTNGTNTAEFFGTEEERDEIFALINDIYYQARIQVNFLAPVAYNSTFANVGNNGVRPANDALRIFEEGEAAGVTSSDPLTVNAYFLRSAPGSGPVAPLSVNGISLIDLDGLGGANGVTLQVGSDLPTFADGQLAVARVTSHEIAHNLGLPHVSGSGNNLLNQGNISNSTLNAGQRATLIASPFSR